MDRDPPLAGIAAYHCQQALEKLAKALLILAGIAFRKTHNIYELAGQVEPAFPELGLEVRALAWVTTWGFAYRYPQEEPEPPPAPDQVRETLTRIEAFRAKTATLVDASRKAAAKE